MDAPMNVEINEPDDQPEHYVLPLNDVDSLDSMEQINLIPDDRSALDHQLQCLANTPRTCSLTYNQKQKRLTFDCRMKRNLHVEKDLDNLEIEIINVNCPCFDARHAELLHNLSFKELQLNELHNTDWIRSNAEEYCGIYQMNTDVLKQVLNRENGQELKHLTINGKNLILEHCWPLNVTFISNNLTSLSIPFMNLSSDEFQEMCFFFTGLTYLNISDTKLGSLKGISRLTELTGLVFHNSNIVNLDGISELRELSNLTMLDVSASIGCRSTFAEMFAESGMTLPALQSFLCTRNPLSAYYINQILTRNRTIKNVGLLDIANIDNFLGLQTAYKDVRFFATENLSQCMESFLFFKTFSTTTSEEIFGKILGILEYNCEEQANNDRHRCLHVLINELLEYPELSCSSTAVIKGIYFLTCNVESNAICSDCKKATIKICLRIIQSDYTLKEAREHAWMVLKPEFFAGSPIELIGEICLQAAISGANDGNRLLCFQYVEIIHNYLGRIPLSEISRIIDNERFRDVLMEHIHEGYYFQNPRDLIPLVKLLTVLNVHSSFFQPHKFVISAHRMMRKYCQLEGTDVRHVYQVPEVTHQTFLDPIHDIAEIQEVILYSVVYMMKKVVKTQIYRTGCSFTERYSSFVVNIMKVILPETSVNNQRFLPKALSVFIYFHYVGRFNFMHILEADLLVFVDAFFDFMNQYTANRHLEQYAVLNGQVTLYGEKLPEESWILVVNNAFDMWKRCQNHRRENQNL
ncbi:unnamed protein product [Caenorhabditis brenneri]